LEDGDFDAQDLGQALEDFRPRFSIVAGGVEFAAARAEEETSGIQCVGRECIPEDGFVGAFLRQAARQGFPGAASIAGAIDAEAAFRGAAKFVGLDGENIDSVGIVWMHDHGKTEVGGHAEGNILPGIAAIVGAIESPVILQEEALGPGGMENDFVHALTELGIFFGHEDDADAAVAGLPRFGAVFAAIEAAGGDGDVEAGALGGIGNDGVKKQAAIAGHPARAMGMIVEATDEGPGFACVARFEEGGGLDAAVHFFWLIFAAESDLPDVAEGGTGFLREAQSSFERIGPTAAEVVGGAEKRAPHEAAGGSPEAVAAGARVEGHGVDALAVKIRAGDIPFSAVARRAEKKSAFVGADEEEHVAIFYDEVVHAAENDGPRAAGFFGRMPALQNRTLHGFESGADFADPLVSLDALFHQAALDDGGEAGRNGGRKRGRRFAQNSGGNFKAGVAVEREAPSGRFVEKHAERPEVAEVIAFLSAQNFRRHVGQRADEFAFERLIGQGEIADFFAFEARGEPEIENFDAAFGCDHNVGTFEVAMDDAAVVGVGERVGDLRAVAGDRVHRKAGGGDEIAEGLAFDQFHDDVEIVVGLADLINGADVGMGERGGGLRFAEKMAAADLVDGAGGDEFEGYVAVEDFVASAVDDAHAAFAEFGEDFVVVESLADEVRGHN